MFDDDNEPKAKAGKVKNLEALSVDELEKYIASMEAEIVRTRAEIEKKKAYASAASSFFKR